MGLFSSGSFADGFVCDSIDKSLRVKVYHQTKPERGTRNVAVMVLSDQTRPHGDKTIAVFNARGRELVNQSATYVARIDYASPEALSTFVNDSDVLGAALSRLKRLIVNVDFSYLDPVKPNTVLPGTLHMIEKDSEKDREKDSEEVSAIDLKCRRYLKNGLLLY